MLKSEIRKFEKKMYSYKIIMCMRNSIKGDPVLA